MAHNPGDNLSALHPRLHFLLTREWVVKVCLVNIKILLFSSTMIALSALIGYAMFRRDPIRAVFARGPVFLECFLVLFWLGFSTLPLAIPNAFQRVLGHPVDSMYVHPMNSYGVQVSGTWWVEAWLDPSRSILLWLLLIGMVWAVINIAQRRSRLLNAIALSSGVLLMGIHVFATLNSFPF